MSQTSAEWPSKSTRTRAELWAKLLAGEVTEVYAPGFRRVLYSFEHTLGLDFLDSQAHIYDREGVPRDAEQLADLARQFSAESRWIAGGGPWFWDVHFAERAEVILIFYTGANDPRLFRTVELGEKIVRAVRWLRRRIALWRLAKAGSMDDGSALDGSFLDVVSGWSELSSVGVAVNNALAQFPEKTFIVRQWDGAGRLAAVKAR